MNLIVIQVDFAVGQSFPSEEDSLSLPLFVSLRRQDLELFTCCLLTA